MFFCADITKGLMCVLSCLSSPVTLTEYLNAIYSQSTYQAIGFQNNSPIKQYIFFDLTEIIDLYRTSIFVLHLLGCYFFLGTVDKLLK